MKENEDNFENLLRHGNEYFRASEMIRLAVYPKEEAYLRSEQERLKLAYINAFKAAVQAEIRDFFGSDGK